jgi:hypothetical protein
MLANNEKKSLLKILASGLVSAIITFAALTMDISAETGNCLYVEQIAADPALSAAYTASIKDAGSMSSGAAIDSFSIGCLACHDGVMAQSFRLRVKNNPGGRAMCLEDIIGGHPVGMEYENYAAANEREYRGEARFSTEMVFAEGKVGCLTCHNPLLTGVLEGGDSSGEISGEIVGALARSQDR